MGHPIHHRTRGLPSALFALVLAAGERVAAADVDLTGDWRFDAPLVTRFGTFTQAGTPLSMVFQDDPSLVYTGTIDAGTGDSLRCR